MRWISRAQAIFFLVAVGISTTASAETLKLYSFRVPVAANTPKGAVSVARGMPMEAGQSFSVGAQGGLSFDGEDGTTFSIIGPAHFRIESQASSSDLRVTFDYGEFFIKAVESTDFSVEGPGFSFPVARRDFALELNPNSESLKFRFVKGSSFPIAGKSLKEGQTYFSTAKETWIAQNDPADISLLEQRHQNNRHLYALSDPLPKDPDPNEFDIRNFMEFGPQLGVLKLSPASGSTFVQNLGGAGILTRLGTHLYLGKFPRAPQRIHFLKAPAVRFGVESSLLLSKMLPIEGLRLGQNIIGVRTFFGFAWRELALDFLVGYQKNLGESPSAKFIMVSPLSLGGDLSIRFDMKEIMDMEAGFIAGARYLYTPFRARSETDTAGVTPTAFKWHFLALHSGLSFRF